MDIRTLLLVITLVLISRAAMLVYVWRVERTNVALRHWAGGSVLVAVGTLLIGLREALPEIISVVLAQALVLPGWLLIDGGIVLAAGYRPPWRAGLAIIGAALAAVVWLTLGSPDFVWRTVAVSLPVMAFDLYAAASCLRHTGSNRTATFRLLAIAIVAFVASNALKTSAIALGYASSMLVAGWQVAQFLVVAILYCLANTVFFVLLTAQELQEKLDLDIAERKRVEEQIRTLAYYDSLTRLPNRRLLADRLALALASSKRSATWGAVLLLDLDNFKPLNDQHGHAVGDLLLIEVARRLTSGLREIDTVARLGGDEFVVVLGNLGPDAAAARRQAQEIAEDIRASLAEPYRLVPDGEPATMVTHSSSATIGIALFLGQTQTQTALLRNADVAMYQAKQGGRNGCQVFDAPA